VTDQPVELRSDTFTLPSEAMLQAALTASLGDDVWGEDPTVRLLEERAAGLMGKEAGLFVSSGTQGNLIALLSHTNRRSEVIVGHKSHILNAEVAGSAVIGGIQLRAVPNTRYGGLDIPAVVASIHPEDVHYAPTSLICVENTHNYCGGAILDEDDMASIHALAAGAGLKVHLDGARIFNAAVALGIDVDRLTQYADSVTFCLSKGLSAPIGSVLCGSPYFIHQARSYRKMLGGGMRQVGFIAAPGLVALDESIERLREDHAHARRLGEALNALPGLSVDLDVLQTNIVIVTLSGTTMSADDLVDAVDRLGIRVAAMESATIRLVTHRNVSGADIDRAIEAFDHVARTFDAAQSRPGELTGAG
jgi:threonine aldolase